MVSLATGTLLARLPLVTLEDACDETEEHPCDAAAQARIRERATLVDALFASLGFALEDKVFVDVRNGDALHKDGVSVDLPEKKLVGSGGVSGAIPAGTFSANSLHADLNARTISLDGNARLHMIPGKLRMP